MAENFQELRENMNLQTYKAQFTTTKTNYKIKIYTLKP